MFRVIFSEYFISKIAIYSWMSEADKQFNILYAHKPSYIPGDRIMSLHWPERTLEIQCNYCTE